MHVTVRIEPNSFGAPRSRRSHASAASPAQGTRATALSCSPARGRRGHPPRPCTFKGMHGSYRKGATFITPRLFVEDFREHSLASLRRVDYGDVRVHFLLRVHGRRVPSALIHHGSKRSSAGLDLRFRFLPIRGRCSGSFRGVPAPLRLRCRSSSWKSARAHVWARCGCPCSRLLC